MVFGVNVFQIQNMYFVFVSKYLKIKGILYLYFVSQCILYFENTFECKILLFVEVGKINKFLTHGP